jgi:hypothetical protein
LRKSLCAIATFDLDVFNIRFFAGYFDRRILQKDVLGLLLA